MIAPGERSDRGANAMALVAIALWGALAWLGVRLSAVPPFLLVGSALTLAGLLAAPTWRRWKMRPLVLALGVYGLFGFHFFLFVALRLARPLEANIVNYLWPLLLVLLAPLLLKGVRTARRPLVGGVLGFVGAWIAIATGHRGAPADPAAAMPDAWLGYGAALVSAFIWATYSLLGTRLRQHGVTYSTAAVGAFCLASGLLALACHAMLEPPYRFTSRDLWPLLALAIGPMGAAFFLWDAALRIGDPRTIGTLAYLAPLISTALLALDDPSRFGWPIVVALLLVVGGAVLGARGTPAPRVTSTADASSASEPHA